MQQADFDHTLFESGNNAGDAALLVKFFHKTMPDKEKSAEEHRAVFKDVEYVDIRVAGSRTSNVCRPARPADISRFPRHYEAFKNRQEVPLEGTPLIEWALISRSQAEELAFVNVKTVEQLAALADNFASQRMGGYDLKAKAIKWLEAAKETKVPLAMQEKLDEAEERAEVAEQRANKLESTLQQMEARLNAMETTSGNSEQVELDVPNTSEVRTSRAKRRTTKE